MSEGRMQRIRKTLAEALDTDAIEITDEGHKHVGHAGAQSGLGHFAVTVRSTRFDGKSRIARHRMVYAALGELMETDIHALSITALASDDA